MTVNFAARSRPTLTRWLPRALGVAEPLSVAMLFAFMLWKTWLRWSDPLVDFPRDLYTSWRVSEGDLLYDHLAIVYGPLPHLVEAAAFRIFGVGAHVIVWMNIVMAVCALLLLRGIFGALGNRLSVWLSSVVFVVVFAFGFFVVNANYNFITPYSTQATYGFVGLLLVLWALLHHLRTNRAVFMVVAGWGLAVAYLDKHEPLFATMCALGFYGLARAVHILRATAPLAVAPGTSLPTGVPGALRWSLRSLAWLAGGFFCLWIPVFLFFWWEGGLAYSLRATDYVVFALFSRNIVNTGFDSYLNQANFGFDHLRQNFLLQCKAGGMLVLTCMTMAAVAWGWTRVRPGRALGWLGLFLVLAISETAFWLAELQAGFWVDIGSAFVFPVCVASLGVMAWSMWSAWQKRVDFTHVLGLAFVGLAACAMFGRMILNARIYQYGFFMMPLAVFFLIQLLVVEAARPGPGARRANTLLPAAFALLVLAGTGVLTRTCLKNYSIKIYHVGAGEDLFYSLPSSTSRNGQMLNLMVQVVKKNAPTARTLVVFPEGIAVNYELRLPSTMTEPEFNPNSMSYVGAQHVLEELKSNPPDIIFLHYRDMNEFGAKYFGDSDANGREIWLWLNSHYTSLGSSGNTRETITGHLVDLYGLNSLVRSIAHNPSTAVPVAPRL